MSGWNARQCIGWAFQPTKIVLYRLKDWVLDDPFYREL